MSDVVPGEAALALPESQRTKGQPLSINGGCLTQGSDAALAARSWDGSRSSRSRTAAQDPLPSGRVPNPRRLKGKGGPTAPWPALLPRALAPRASLIRANHPDRTSIAYISRSKLAKPQYRQFEWNALEPVPGLSRICPLGRNAWPANSRRPRGICCARTCRIARRPWRWRHRVRGRRIGRACR